MWQISFQGCSENRVSFLPWFLLHFITICKIGWWVLFPFHRWSKCTFFCSAISQARRGRGFSSYTIQISYTPFNFFLLIQALPFFYYFFFLPFVFNFFFLLCWALPSHGSWWFVTCIVAEVCYLHFLCRLHDVCCSGNDSLKVSFFHIYKILICITYMD